MNEFLTKNIGWKILSLILAVMLWLIVINSQDPEQKRWINNIPIKVLNENEFIVKNKHVNYIDGKSVSIYIKGTRKTLDKINKDDFYAYTDLEQRDPITQAVPIRVEVRDNIEVEILDRNPWNLKVELENIITRQFDISCDVEGKPQANYVAGTPKISPQNAIVINGPESQINKIRSVVVKVDVSNANKDVTIYAEPKVLDENGDEIAELTKDLNKVKVTIPIYKTKKVFIEPYIEGIPPEGYGYTGYEINPESVITIYGKESVIDNIDKIQLPKVSLNEITTSRTITYDTNSILRSTNSEIYLNDGPNEIKLKLNVEKEVSKEIVIPIKDINVKNWPQGLQFRFVSNGDLKINVKGLKDKINRLLKSDINASIDLSELDIGEHEVKVNLLMPFDIKVDGDNPTVKIELLEGNDEVPPNDNEGQTEVESNMPLEQQLENLNELEDSSAVLKKERAD